MIQKIILCCTLAVSFVVGVLVIVTPVRADSTITVTTTGDVIASDGLCSLREAIIAANTDSAYSDCPGGSGADTIDFSPNLSPTATFVLTNTGANEDNAATGDLDIMGILTINGVGLDHTILDGNGTDRVFEILPSARATISGVKIYDGNPGPMADGGGIAVDLTGRLTLNNSIVSGNTATTGGGIKVLGLLTLNNSTVEGNRGGGISNDAGLLLLSNAHVIGNTGGYGISNQNVATIQFDSGTVSGNDGGGIYNANSTATLSNLSITDNTGGGGVYNWGTSTARLTLSNSSILSNTATSGAGILNDGIGALADIQNTRISSNTATAAGGGVNNNGSMTLVNSTIDHNQARTGGGIDHAGSSLQLTNVTISSNSVSDNGGGLYNRSGASLTNVTLNDNAASGFDTGGNIYNDGDTAQLSLVNTIVANAGAGGNCFNNEGFLNSTGHNLESANSCGLSATGDITNTDPLLDSLKDNGGTTFTHALLPGSPAIDSGDNASCPDSDQRGLSRPQGAACDIGAYEFGLTTDVMINKTRQGAGTVMAGGRITYTISVTNTGPTTPVTVTVVDSWTPIGAVVRINAPGCVVNLAGGNVSCTLSGLGLGSAPVPDPYIVFTTSEAFSGTISNMASVSVGDGVSDITPNNDVSAPVLVSVLTAETPPATHTDLSISKTRLGSGSVVAGECITFTLAVTNAGPATPVTATVMDTWTPITAVVGVDAPGCAVDLGGGVITCTRANLGIGSALLPDPHVVFTTSAAFSGTLANAASITVTGFITDVNPANNVADPVLVSVLIAETLPITHTDLSISKTRLGSGSVMAGERITFTLAVTNAGPATPVIATVVDTWTPITAVVGVDAPGCAVDLGGGVVTCTHTNLGVGSTLLPDPHVVFTTSAVFSGTLTNTASVTTADSITDINPANNVAAPIVVAIITTDRHNIYLPVILR